MTSDTRKTAKTKEYCDLCGLEIDGDPVVRAYDGENKHFCCKGCARVYDIAKENDMLDEVLAHPEEKREPLKDLVFDPGETAYFSVKGMWCAGCAAAAEQILRRSPGVKSADVSFAAERGRLQYDPQKVGLDELLKSLDKLGYQARNLVDPAQDAIERNQERTLIQVITAVAFGMQVMFIYLVQLYPRYAAGQVNDPEVRKLQYMVWILATPILLYGGISFLRGAWRAFRARTATMDTLVAMGTLSAYIYSAYFSLQGGEEVYFDSVAMITSFVMIGRYLETLGGAQARKDIRKLLKLQPDQAWRREDEGWKQVKAATLEPGDLILIKPGEYVPADAVVVEGEAALNESMLTGESKPVNKGSGDNIYAGTLLTDEALIGRVLCGIQDARLAKITLLVDKTLSTKPPIQRLADQASAWFAFGIIGAAGLTFLGWWLGRGSLAEAMLAAVAVLVVACPCALGLATPLALAIALGRSTQAGILVRNPTALESAADTRRIVFDKTGTLTLGELRLIAVHSFNEEQCSGTELLRLAAAVEQFSEHPIAQAIVHAYQEDQANPLPQAREFQNLRGLGASARFQDGRRILVGSSQFLGVGGKMDSHSVRAQQAAEGGDTIIWIGWDDQTQGMMILRDQPNETARETIRSLQDRGITAALLSGDGRLTTRAIAHELGVMEYEGNCSPAEKASRIQAWQEEDQHVAMVGDGVNDAPALAQASLSITVSRGTDIAGETSDLLLTRPNLGLIPWFISLSGHTRRIIRQNLMWAFAYNLIAVPLAAFGLIRPVFAAIAMAASSLLVVGNSLRLRKAGRDGRT